MCLHFIVLRWHSSAYLGHLQIISAGFICTIKIEEWVHSCATSQHYQSYQRWFWRGDIYRILKLKFVAKRKNFFVCLCLCFFLVFLKKSKNSLTSKHIQITHTFSHSQASITLPTNGQQQKNDD